MNLERRKTRMLNQVLLLKMIFKGKKNKAWCFGGRRCSDAINQNVYETMHPETQKAVKIIKSTCSICGRTKSQIFTK